MAPQKPPLVSEGQIGLSTFITSFWITFTENLMLFGRFSDFQPKGYPYENVQNPYFSKSQPDLNKFGFLAEGKNVENIYQSSPERVHRTTI